MVSKLSEIIRQVQVTKGFSKVLDPEQLEDVECKALRLSAAVTEYLAKVILFLEEGSLTIHLSLSSPNVVGRYLKNLFEKDFGPAKEKIDERVRAYQTSMGFLKATMMVKVLQHVKSHDEMEKRRKILQWIWGGDYWEIHKSLQQERVEGTGDWFLDTDAHKKWLKGESIFLICPGIRMDRLYSQTDF